MADLPILGIDPQSRYFTACLVEPDGETRVFQVHGDGDQLAACREAARALAEAVDYVYAAGVCWIEEPIGSFYKVIATQNRMIGAIAAALPRAWSTDLIPAAEWKHLCGLARSATKEESVIVARLRLGEQIENEHYADAANIAYACQVASQYRPPEEEQHG